MDFKKSNSVGWQVANQKSMSFLWSGIIEKSFLYNVKISVYDIPVILLELR